ncbi:MAG: ABC transporter substrate-binding protein [Ornithinimicrobium sp.]
MSSAPVAEGTAMRIVSLLPSATEILYAVGAGESVVGVTFECDEPAAARSSAAIVSTSSLPETVDGRAPTPREIDAHVRARLAAGEDLYHLDRDALSGLDATLVITQDLCAVCAVDVSEVRDALAHLGCAAQVVTTDPHTLDEVLASIQQIGDACDRSDEAAALIASLQDRLASVPGEPAGGAPRVAVLEWTDPPFAPGHWVPEMVTRAGGLSVLGVAGARSVPVSWADVEAADPEIVIVAPCGFDLPTSTALAEELLLNSPLAAMVASGDGSADESADGAGVQVWAVDANASFARPGPRLVDGIEAVAAILDPARYGMPPAHLAYRLR